MEELIASLSSWYAGKLFIILSAAIVTGTIIAKSGSFIWTLLGSLLLLLGNICYDFFRAIVFILLVHMYISFIQKEAPQPIKPDPLATFNQTPFANVVNGVFGRLFGQ